jgi:hypothetical protein
MQNSDPQWLNRPPVDGDEAAWLKERSQRNRRFRLRNKRRKERKG